MRTRIHLWLSTAWLGTVASIGLPAAAGAASATDMPGAIAPDFALPSAQGGNLRLSEYRGKVVIVGFWSSRCSSCDTQLAQLDSLQSMFGSAGLVTLAVSVDSNPARARAHALDLVQGRHLSIPMLVDADRAVGRIYGVERLPTTVLIDRAGRIRRIHGDYRRIDNPYISQVRALLENFTPVP